tara:strand:- start:1762 stop:2067 length:306 start_codon:yes stop_codon:yes gene_type:complete
MGRSNLTRLECQAARVPELFAQKIPPPSAQVLTHPEAFVKPWRLARLVLWIVATTHPNTSLQATRCRVADISLQGGWHHGGEYFFTRGKVHTPYNFFTSGS